MHSAPKAVPIRFTGDAREYFGIWIAIGNAVAVVVSLGMLLPWARIRMARYLCANTWVRPVSSLDRFVGEAERRRSAIGDAHMDMDGADVGVAV